MAHISGIKLHRTSTGKIKSVTFDMKKHGDILQPILKQVGAVEDEDDFEKKWATGIPIEEARARTLAVVRSLPWK